MRFLLFVFLFLISATQLFAKTVEVEMWTNFNGEKKNQNNTISTVDVSIFQRKEMKKQT